MTESIAALQGMRKKIQLTPTVSYWLVANGVVFAKVISLGDLTPSSGGPTGGWEAKSEHWFVAKELPEGKLTGLLGATGTELEIIAKHHCPGLQLTQAFIADADACLDTEQWEFHWRAKGLLIDDDWASNGQPSSSSTAYYYVQQDAPYPPRRAQVVLEVDGADTGKLASVSWITDEKHSGYGCSMKLKHETMPSSWPHYYTVPKP